MGGEIMATYTQIQDYIKNKYNYTPKTCLIAHAKEVYGISVKEANNRIDSDSRVYPCPKDKLEDLKEAFEYFKIL